MKARSSFSPTLVATRCLVRWASPLTAVVILALTLAACGGDEPASTADTTAKTAAQLETIRQQYGVPALGAAMIEGDQVTFLDATGVRRLGDPTPVTNADLFHLGSCTKAMTAALVGTFVDEGRLDWDDRLVDRWPELRGRIDPGFANVTIAHFLAHRAGLDDAALEARYAASLPQDASVMAQRRWVAEHALADAPVHLGAYAYSNYAYVIVGALLEHMTGRQWETLMRQRIFAPLEMASCGFGAAGTPGQVDQPWGHVDQNGTLVPIPPGPDADNPPLLGPAGTVHCSMEDWSKFLRDQLRGARGDKGLLAHADYVRMQTPWPGGDYALGWGVIDTQRGHVLRHAGSNTFNLVIAELSTEQDWGVLSVTNCASQACAQAAEAAITATWNAEHGAQ
jgi:D-alanyl-D-alanine carboxypeptidase